MATRADLTLYDAVASSNLGSQEKSALRRVFDQAMALPDFMRPNVKQVHGALSSMRVGGESIMMGLLLGSMNALRKEGLDIHGVPADLALAVAGLGGSAFAAKSEMAPDARTMGGNALTVFTFRTTDALIRAKRVATGATHAGESVDTDPVVLASRDL